MLHRLLAWTVIGGFAVQAIESVSFSAPLLVPPIPHEQPPVDPWVSRPRGAIASSMQCAPIMHDGYLRDVTSQSTL